MTSEHIPDGAEGRTVTDQLFSDAREIGEDWGRELRDRDGCSAPELPAYDDDAVMRSQSLERVSGLVYGARRPAGTLRERLARVCAAAARSAYREAA